MSKVKLTPSRINEFKCPPESTQAYLWDEVVNGLAVRATTGSQSLIFQSRLNGKTIRMTIGGIDVWHIEAARTEARRLQSIIDQGRDPREVKRQTINADAASRKKTKQDNTPALIAWQTYISARSNKWSTRHKADHETMTRDGGEFITRGKRAGMQDTKEQGILRPLLSLPLQGITRDRIAAWVEIEAPRRPTRTRLALSLLATFITWCNDRPEYRDQANTDACKRMKKDLPKPQARDDCLQREQLALWFEHVKRIPNPIISAYLQSALLTGARRNELATVKWDDIDFQWASLIIRDKVEGTRTIPLTPYVSNLLANLPRRNEWVFSSPSAQSGRLMEPRLALNQALKNAGLPALSIHGLRRSFATMAEWTECPAGVVAQIMGHKPSAIAEKHYTKRSIDLLRKWHISIEEWILEQAQIEFVPVKAGLRVVTTA